MLCRALRRATLDRTRCHDSEAVVVPRLRSERAVGNHGYVAAARLVRTPIVFEANLPLGVPRL